MSKYKLIKTYPGSPELGTIASRGMGIKFEHPNGIVNGFVSSKGKDFESLIENQPEFWEEVVEKEYEILSLFLMRSIKHEIIDVTDHSDKYIKGLLECKVNHIYSVRRLSDGEVFTLYDNVRDSLTDRLTNNKIQTISSFTCGVTPKGDDYFAVQFESGTTAGLSTISKIKQPLFTTEDGVEIYKGDTVYCFNNYYSIVEFKNIQWKLARRVFSTREAAREYILMNKPCLSINDVLNIKLGSLDTLSKKLKELVKTKL